MTETHKLLKIQEIVNDIGCLQAQGDANASPLCIGTALWSVIQFVEHSPGVSANIRSD